MEVADSEQMTLEHNLKSNFLFFPAAFEDKRESLRILFKKMAISLKVTNYRLVFTPSSKEAEFAEFISKQPNYIHSFFELRMAQISEVVQENSRIYLYTRFDGRAFKLTHPLGKEHAKGLA